MAKLEPFTSLLLLAHGEHWCWRVACTTCGHLHFRYAYQQLLAGVNPQDEAWLVHREQTAYDIPGGLGPLPQHYTPAEQATLLKLAGAVDLTKVLQECGTEYTLGPLGLVFHHCEIMERAHRFLTRPLKKKLDEVLTVAIGADASSRLLELGRNEPWTYSALGRVENHLRRIYG